MAVFLFFSFVLLLLPPFVFRSFMQLRVNGELKINICKQFTLEVILELNKSRSLKTPNPSFTGIPGLQRRHLVAIHPATCSCLKTLT